METVRTDMTIADFAAAYDRNDIVVNRDYQRSDKVWPDAAKSFLIETLILGYPLPKLSMYQITNVRTRRTVKEIVDGQQRATTISDYLHNSFALSSKLQTERLRGRRYDDLANSDKSRLLSYSLPIDLFVAATPFDVRETFRRMNSYTVPLNAEESRHARFQGPFKWFVYNIAKEFEETFIAIGTFNAKKLVRMQDTKLISEFLHAFENGIETTSKTTLDRLYETYDDDYPDDDRASKRFRYLLEQLDDIVDLLKGTSVSKQHMMYSLMLALAHSHREVPSLTRDYEFTRRPRRIPASFPGSIEWLDELLDSEQVPRRYQRLYDACTVKTNVKSERITRFQWFCEQLEA